ncbi:MAG: TlpA family protein disulfide reductase [Burkholderiales bacterium]|nr:TlpA family protein disulfide reductase [Burkholderiales bacterium]
MKTTASPTPAPVSVWTRRAWLGGAATLLAAPWEASRAQSAAAAEEEAHAPGLPALGSRLVVPPVKLLDGSSFDPAQAEGKALLIYWWASFCPFCALQSPAMEALWRAQRDKGLVMLALSIDTRPQDATAYLHKKGYTFPAAWTSPAWRRAFPKPKGLPVTLVRGRDGRVALAEAGQMFDEDVAAISRLV